MTQEEFNDLCAGRNTGQQILLENGKLTLADREPVVLSRDEAAAKERAWRDSALADIQWLRDRHRDQLEIGSTATLAPAQFKALLVYLQVLRDWPQSEQFPQIEHRPVAPPWISEHIQ
ncbi:phage tail assembly chaperone [Pseudomonas sp. GD03858]|uniref:phage tail assembly chaperone n=1 Tax=unclassified Pseudomonas TaxID=196821 RepID=UPI002447B2BB|nr:MULTISPECIES: phage tail assembly chaperone [unclassified Pseudomonas]MDH0645598.1 phage tail assembly chaperone [Pseudomonas sp. GD03867]MDH0661278.1 phage tail assembly chaperone [Pseudomonas sp. GD03858]